MYQLYILLLLLINCQYLNGRNKFDFTADYDRKVTMKSREVSYHSVETKCERKGLQEYFVSSNKEFKRLQLALKDDYRDYVFWLKVLPIYKTGVTRPVNYYWANEEVNEAAWFFIQDGATANEPNYAGEGCHKEPECCIRLTTFKERNDGGLHHTLSGKHELADISCSAQASFFCVEIGQIHGVFTTPTLRTTTAAAAVTRPTPQTNTTSETTTEAATSNPATSNLNTSASLTHLSHLATTVPISNVTLTSSRASETTSTVPTSTSTGSTSTSTGSTSTSTLPTSTSTVPTSTSTATLPFSSHVQSVTNSTIAVLNETLSSENSTQTTVKPHETDSISIPMQTATIQMPQTTSKSELESTDPTSANSSSSTNQSPSICSCSCQVTNISHDDIEKVIENTRRYMAVHVPTLSSTIRRLESASDHRTSSVAIGVLAIAIIISIYCVIVMHDTQEIVHGVSKRLRKIRFRNS